MDEVYQAGFGLDKQRRRFSSVTYVNNELDADRVVIR